MFSRLFQRQAVRAQRNFSTSSAVRSIHFHDGLYTNIPFKVKGRKVPLAVPVSIYFALGFGIPVVAVLVQLKRAGNI